MKRFEMLTQRVGMTYITMRVPVPEDFEAPVEWGEATCVVLALLVDNNKEWMWPNFSIETQTPLHFLEYLSENAYGSGFKHGVGFLERMEEREELYFAVSPKSFTDAIESLENKVNEADVSPKE